VINESSLLQTPSWADSLRTLRTENHSNGFDKGSDSHESPGFLCRRALLIRPKKDKDHVDPSSLPAPSTNHPAMHTTLCMCGASGSGSLALVYHSTTTPETQSEYRGIRLQFLHCITWTSRGVSVRSPVIQASEPVRTYLHSRGVDVCISHLFDPIHLSREPTIRVFLRHDS
jgi:hypothetical protein